MKTFKDLKEWNTVWIIDYKDIKEYKVHYCIPYNGYYCLVIKDFSMDPFRNGEWIYEEHTVRLMRVFTVFIIIKILILKLKVI